jgi:hypothetical protein
MMGNITSFGGRVTLVIACGGGWIAACGFDSSGGGVPSDDGGGAASTGTSTSGDPSGSPSTSGSSAASTADTTAAQTDAGTTNETSATTEGESAANETDGRVGLAGDDAVVVRYYLDEQADGVANTDALDAAGPPQLDLTLQVHGASSTPQYVETQGNRGLHWPQHGQGGYASAPASNSKLMDMNGSTEATLEVVVDVTSVFVTDEPWARILVWQPDIVPFNVQMGLLGYWHDNAIALDIRSAWQANNNPPTGRWALGSQSPGRIVVHAVFDTKLAAEDRVRLYVDGAIATPTFVNPPDEDATLTVTNDAFLLLGNRPTGDTAFGGTLYYAAIYDRALDPAELTNNATLLSVNDDPP